MSVNATHRRMNCWAGTNDVIGLETPSLIPCYGVESIESPVVRADIQHTLIYNWRGQYWIARRELPDQFTRIGIQRHDPTVLQAHEHHSARHGRSRLHNIAQL